MSIIINQILEIKGINLMKPAQMEIINFLNLDKLIV